MGRRGSRSRMRSRPRGIGTRLRRMARIVLRYATPWRLLMILALAAGLLAATIVDHGLVQSGGVVIAVLSLLTLLAQLHHSLKRVALNRSAADAGRLALAPTRRRTIGRSRAIVSVIIPGKNEARYGRACIESLQAQTLDNFEAIIIDDCSTDSTLDVLHDAIGDDPRFKIIRTDRSVGIGLARNHGVRVAGGRYVTFLDLDDFLAPDSLASRVELAEAHADMPWVAGSYCWHEPVAPETTPATWRPPTAVRREPVSWLGHYDDNFFIASAPLIRRDVFLTVGGFDDARTAEDAVFWFRMLRWGFILLASNTVGIAYRQKPTSHAVSTAVEMRNTIAGLLEERSEPSSPPVGQAGPFYFEADLGKYRAAVGFTRRTAAALGIAVAGGALEAVVDDLVRDLRSVPPPLVGWEVDVIGRAVAASKRVTRPRGEGHREASVTREIERHLRPLIDAAQRGAAAWQESGDQPTLPTGRATARAVRKPLLLTVTPQSLKSLVAKGKPILLLPSSAYHTDELIELVEELRRHGFAPVAMLNQYRWRTTGTALSRVDVPAVEALPAGDWLLDFAAVLTFNDWGEYFGEYVQYVAGKAPVSFAKVEGVQDWDDLDTGRIRNPYLASDVILCQGENDVRALEGRRARLEIVGSDRLEAIWHAPLPPDAEPRVVANVNFTYRVQTEHRDLWVETLREACRRADVPLDLSLHPSETAKYPGLAATEPIRHLLVQDSILVSRFSTVLFEGMARGCSVIYYNPHGERVPTFHHPDGAFDVAEDPDTLARMVQAARGRSRSEAKERAAPFFRRQVSMEPGTTVAARTANVIERYVTEGSELASANASGRTEVPEKV